MENIKKNPLLMGLLGTAGGAALLCAVDLILSLIKKRTFAEQISDPINLIILIVGSIACGISAYMNAKKNLEGKQEKK